MRLAFPAAARAKTGLFPAPQYPAVVQVDGTGKCYPRLRLQGPGLMMWEFPEPGCYDV